MTTVLKQSSVYPKTLQCLAIPFSDGTSCNTGGRKGKVFRKDLSIEKRRQEWRRRYQSRETWHFYETQGVPRWQRESANQCSRGKRWGSIPGSGRSPGAGNGTLLQYSCWENPMDRGTAGSHPGVARSGTQPSHFARVHTPVHSPPGRVTGHQPSSKDGAGKARGKSQSLILVWMDLDEDVLHKFHHHDLP